GAAARPHPPTPPPVCCGHARGLEAARVCATEATSRARRLTPAPRPTTTTRGHGVEDGAVCGGDARRGAASPPPPMGGCRASPVWARGILLGPDLRSSAPCSSLLAPAPGDAHTAAGHRARARYGLGGGCSPRGAPPPIHALVLWRRSRLPAPATITRWVAWRTPSVRSGLVVVGACPLVRSWC